ncbi:hypothetical protein [Paenibacillus dakarensis]|uniref:hypothetical protein n=1 Tax=Paenibacillus dakarensis TaxID=1527293 RepID=UPI0006D58DA4|nr:hypothetical protein [Paenibacillus dakarensis]
MTEQGRVLFYDNSTGNKIIEAPSQRGDYFTPFEIDYLISIFPELRDRVRESFDYIELEYGQYDQDFDESNGWRINIETKQIEFNYRDIGNSPDDPPVYQPPLTEQVAQLQAADLDNKEAIASLFEMVLAGTEVLTNG